MLPAWPVAVSIGVFVASAIVLVWIGLLFARVVDRLADRTGMGEAVAGAVLLGASTSLPGLITTVIGAIGGNASFAVSNALGGIAAQTMFVALADLSYRRANLEHAAASVPNLLQALVLIALGALVFIGIVLPEFAIGGVHVVTPLLVLTYVGGLIITRRSHEEPMWWPRRTVETRVDVPSASQNDGPVLRLWLRFAVMAGIVATTGFLVGHAGLSLVQETGIRGSVVGGLLTSVVTSLPELITVIAAVRIGALTLAIGDIVGGNTFDVLFLFAADVAYRAGPVYAAVDAGTQFLLALTMLMTAVLAAGLVARDKAGIGFEGVLLLGLYSIGVAVLISL